jgi:hypothetical protein
MARPKSATGAYHLSMRSITNERLTGFIVAFGLVGALLTSWLVASELFRQPTCPSLLGIPACYMVLAAYVAATVGAWRMSAMSNAVFLIGAGVVTAIGLYFSTNQLRGVVECPTFEGLPMCYVSLVAGAGMLIAFRVRVMVTRSHG